ncbi:glucan biosynthesis protein [Methylovirgula sp. 4M-Z18]|uniref:glucan biosynthesis protein n=1 Tax=Methylovirgula sp. 4M-Z18 TaxID=2293567 RepID=UPI001FE096EC|nr:glucan biosynthesis protein [Methylovirgula sp. 4M-Z18]
MERRVILKMTAATFAAGMTQSLFSPASAQTPPAPAQPIAFDPTHLVEQARELAKKPFVAPPTDLPEPFTDLTYDQYVGLRAKPDAVQWVKDNVGFEIEPLHRGYIFSAPMEINLVVDGTVQRLAYKASDFDFGHLQPPLNIADIGFSGFRVLQPRDNAPAIDVAIFQGASFFRALAKGQAYGVSARALAIRTADGVKGEEFPVIRAVWIEKPTLAANALVIHALLDSESVTGAYRFTLHPGDATIIDTECTLIPRVDIDHFGLALMQASYLFGSLDRHHSEDIRPNVYDVSGLQIEKGNGEWIWRPVSNRETLQISVFADQNPKGFGLLQRDRNFERFQDDDQHWERRPSLWIEPIGDWGEGSVILIEIPSDFEVNQNIIAYWRPKQVLAANSETQFAYRQFWCWHPPAQPPLAHVTGARSGKAGKRRRFMVDFAGDILGDPAQSGDIKANLWAGAGTISNVRSFPSRETKTFRVSFDLDPGSETLAELRLVLENGGKPMSETWLYRWTP